LVAHYLCGYAVTCGWFTVPTVGSLVWLPRLPVATARFTRCTYNWILHARCWILLRVCYVTVLPARCVAVYVAFTLFTFAFYVWITRWYIYVWFYVTAFTFTFVGTLPLPYRAHAVALLPRYVVTLFTYVCLYRIYTRSTAHARCYRVLRAHRTRIAAGCYGYHTTHHTVCSGYAALRFAPPIPTHARYAPRVDLFTFRGFTLRLRTRPAPVRAHLRSRFAGYHCVADCCPRAVYAFRSDLRLRSTRTTVDLRLLRFTRICLRFVPTPFTTTGYTFPHAVAARAWPARTAGLPVGLPLPLRFLRLPHHAHCPAVHCLRTVTFWLPVVRSVTRVYICSVARHARTRHGYGYRTDYRTARFTVRSRYVPTTPRPSRVGFWLLPFLVGLWSHYAFGLRRFATCSLRGYLATPDWFRSRLVTFGCGLPVTFGFYGLPFWFAAPAGYVTVAVTLFTARLHVRFLAAFVGYPRYRLDFAVTAAHTRLPSRSVTVNPRLRSAFCRLPLHPFALRCPPRILPVCRTLPTRVRTFVCVAFTFTFTFTDSLLRLRLRSTFALRSHYAFCWFDLRLDIPVTPCGLLHTTPRLHTRTVYAPRITRHTVQFYIQHPIPTTFAAFGLVTVTAVTRFVLRALMQVYALTFHCCVQFVGCVRSAVQPVTVTFYAARTRVTTFTLPSRLVCSVVAVACRGLFPARFAGLHWYATYAARCLLDAYLRLPLRLRFLVGLYAFATPRFCYAAALHLRLPHLPVGCCYLYSHYCLVGYYLQFGLRYPFGCYIPARFAITATVLPAALRLRSHTFCLPALLDCPLPSLFTRWIATGLRSRTGYAFAGCTGWTFWIAGSRLVAFTHIHHSVYTHRLYHYGSVWFTPYAPYACGCALVHTVATAHTLVCQFTLPAARFAVVPPTIPCGLLVTAGSCSTTPHTFTDSSSYLATFCVWLPAVLPTHGCGSFAFHLVGSHSLHTCIYAVLHVPGLLPGCFATLFQLPCLVHVTVHVSGSLDCHYLLRFLLHFSSRFATLRLLTYVTVAVVAFTHTVALRLRLLPAFVPFYDFVPVLRFTRCLLVHCRSCSPLIVVDYSLRYTRVTRVTVCVLRLHVVTFALPQRSVDLPHVPAFTLLRLRLFRVCYGFYTHAHRFTLILPRLRYGCVTTLYTFVTFVVRYGTLRLFGLPLQFGLHIPHALATYTPRIYHVHGLLVAHRTHCVAVLLPFAPAVTLVPVPLAGSRLPVWIWIAFAIRLPAPTHATHHLPAHRLRSVWLVCCGWILPRLPLPFRFCGYTTFYGLFWLPVRFCRGWIHTLTVPCHTVTFTVVAGFLPPHTAWFGFARITFTRLIPVVTVWFCHVWFCLLPPTHAFCGLRTTHVWFCRIRHTHSAPPHALPVTRLVVAFLRLRTPPRSRSAVSRCLRLLPTLLRVAGCRYVAVACRCLPAFCTFTTRYVTTRFAAVYTATDLRVAVTVAVAALLRSFTVLPRSTAAPVTAPAVCTRCRLRGLRCHVYVYCLRYRSTLFPVVPVHAPPHTITALRVYCVSPVWFGLHLRGSLGSVVPVHHHAVCSGLRAHAFAVARTRTVACARSTVLRFGWTGLPVLLVTVPRSGSVAACYATTAFTVPRVTFVAVGCLFTHCYGSHTVHYTRLPPRLVSARLPFWVGLGLPLPRLRTPFTLPAFGLDSRLRYRIAGYCRLDADLTRLRFAVPARWLPRVYAHFVPLHTFCYHYRVPRFAVAVTVYACVWLLRVTTRVLRLRLPRLRTLPFPVTRGWLFAVHAVVPYVVALRLVTHTRFVAAVRLPAVYVAVYVLRSAFTFCLRLLRYLPRLLRDWLRYVVVTLPRVRVCYYLRCTLRSAAFTCIAVLPCTHGYGCVATRARLPTRCSWILALRTHGLRLHTHLHTLPLVHTHHRIVHVTFALRSHAFTHLPVHYADFVTFTWFGLRWLPVAFVHTRLPHYTRRAYPDPTRVYVPTHTLPRRATLRTARVWLHTQLRLHVYTFTHTAAVARMHVYPLFWFCFTVQIRFHGFCQVVRCLPRCGAFVGLLFRLDYRCRTLRLRSDCCVTFTFALLHLHTPMIPVPLLLVNLLLLLHCCWLLLCSVVNFICCCPTICLLYLFIVLFCYSDEVVDFVHCCYSFCYLLCSEPLFTALHRVPRVCYHVCYRWICCRLPDWVAPDSLDCWTLFITLRIARLFHVCWIPLLRSVVTVSGCCPGLHPVLLLVACRIRYPCVRLFRRVCVPLFAGLRTFTFCVRFTRLRLILLLFIVVVEYSCCWYICYVVCCYVYCCYLLYCYYTLFYLIHSTPILMLHCIVDDVFCCCCFECGVYMVRCCWFVEFRYHVVTHSVVLRYIWLRWLYSIVVAVVTVVVGVVICCFWVRLRFVYVGRLPGVAARTARTFALQLRAAHAHHTTRTFCDRYWPVYIAFVSLRFACRSALRTFVTLRTFTFVTFICVYALRWLLFALPLLLLRWIRLWVRCCVTFAFTWCPFVTCVALLFFTLFVDFVTVLRLFVYVVIPWLHFVVDLLLLILHCSLLRCYVYVDYVVCLFDLHVLAVATEFVALRWTFVPVPLGCSYRNVAGF